MFGVFLGVHHRHLLCSDVVRQQTQIQQFIETPHAQQQHGWKNLDPWHLFPQLTQIWRPLDHDTQSPSAALEQWKSDVYSKVCPLRAEWMFVWQNYMSSYSCPVAFAFVPNDTRCPLQHMFKPLHFIHIYLCQGLLNQTECVHNTNIKACTNAQSTIFCLFCNCLWFFLLGWLLMRNATLSCITFPWMNIRALWSFQAVGVKFLCQSVTQPQSCPERCQAANPHTLPLSANHALPILANQTLTLQKVCTSYHPLTLQWVRTDIILLQLSLHPLSPLLSLCDPSIHY